MAKFFDYDGAPIEGVRHGSLEEVTEDPGRWVVCLVYLGIETAHPAAVYCVRGDLNAEATMRRVLGAFNIPGEAVRVVPLVHRPGAPAGGNAS